MQIKWIKSGPQDLKPKTDLSETISGNLLKKRLIKPIYGLPSQLLKLVAK